MALKPPPGSNTSTSLITNTVVPPHTQTQQFSEFSLFQMLLSQPYVYIFITLALLIVVFIAVYISFQRSYMKDPIRNGLIRQIRRSKRSDVVVVNIDISTRSAQLYIGEKLSPSLYTVQDRKSVV